MATEKFVKSEQTVSLRNLAVAAAMRYGSFEASGEARLVVMREAGLMIAYRTPFNPLPTLTDSMRFEAAVRGKNAYREPYGIEVWQERLGKVLSIGWRGQNPPVVDHYECGLWEHTLADIAGETADPAFCRKCASALTSGQKPTQGEQHGRPRGRKRAQVSGRAGRDG
ncbi:MAG: hypothetical protein ABSD74_05445 [Rhizomicrobium sp.]|jgi:hypothetical protein